MKAADFFTSKLWFGSVRKFFGLLGYAVGRRQSAESDFDVNMGLGKAQRPDRVFTQQALRYPLSLICRYIRTIGIRKPNFHPISILFPSSANNTLYSFKFSSKNSGFSVCTGRMVSGFISLTISRSSLAEACPEAW